MNQPTFKQIGDLYHALWELQKEAEESEKTARAYREAYAAEEEYSYKLCAAVRKAREYLKCGEVERALKELDADSVLNG